MLRRRTFVVSFLVLACPLLTAGGADPVVDTTGLTRLAPEQEVWVDKANRRVILVGEIVRREGPMEMFACLRRTKEHESVVAVNCKAQLAHAGLIAVGAEAGNPVKFLPEYKAAAGTEVDVLLYWSDEKGQRQQARAQQWLRQSKTGKEMEYPWVFAGSGFWVDRQSGERFYQAEDGDFICVSNFVTAMLDVPVKSSQENSGLLFEAFTERIPPRKTRVTLVLSPRLKDIKNERGNDPRLDLLPAPKFKDDDNK